MAYPLITDSHCHLDFPEFENGMNTIVDRASQYGVHRILTICTSLSEEPKNRAIAERFDGVFYAAGTHPMNAGTDQMATKEQLLALSKHPKFIGIGETGLDYYYTKESAAFQKKSFLVHIEAAQISGLPLIVHARAADDDIADILSTEFKNAPYCCVMHCFTAGKKLAKTALDLGFYLSMSGIAAFPKSTELRNTLKTAPIDRILLETDSPYLAPPPHRGKRNEPAYTRYTAEIGAHLFGMSYETFAAQTEQNFELLFSKKLRRERAI